ncbi:hypothetical protein D3C77_385060 [compost metagenome]
MEAGRALRRLALWHPAVTGLRVVTAKLAQLAAPDMLTRLLASRSAHDGPGHSVEALLEQYFFPVIARTDSAQLFLAE